MQRMRDQNERVSCVCFSQEARPFIERFRVEVKKRVTILWLSEVGSSWWE
jgi:hypothetical protein